MHGFYYLLFFGSTLCPDVCPLTLAKIMKSVQIIQRKPEGKQYIQVVPVFVTVNPNYDTPKRLVDFRNKMFGEELLCLRDENNESDGLRHILKQFKVPVGVND